MDGIKQWFSQLDWNQLVLMGVGAAACLLCIMVHEIGHGLCALWLGDDTAKRDGRLSFNPLRHIDWIGLLMLLTVHFGWAKPVRVNPLKLRHPRTDMALVSLAGPVSNLIFAVLLTPLYVYTQYRYLETDSLLWYHLSYFSVLAISLNVGLAVFNLFPIPPLDGSKVLFSVLPVSIYRKIIPYERYGMVLIVALLWLGVLDTPLNAVRDFVMTFIFQTVGIPVLRLLG